MGEHTNVIYASLQIFSCRELPWPESIQTNPISLVFIETVERYRPKRAALGGCFLSYVFGSDRKVDDKR